LVFGGDSKVRLCFDEAPPEEPEHLAVAIWWLQLLITKQFRLLYCLLENGDSKNVWYGFSGFFAEAVVGNRP
jgi:hypothetical protein